jgi:redox-sensitive bicupin YhaK (pirin superfamily)
MAARRVVLEVRAEETSDGAGVRLRRSIGAQGLAQLDPFLLLDEFKSAEASDYAAGFPDHPHRGFETVTYMLAGAMEHRDHAGHHGRLEAGGVQWMTAGRGIIHSEMPLQVQGLMWGFQLWVNLPARDKMAAPRYQEFPAAAIPEVTAGGGARVRVVAGSSLGVDGAVRGIATDPLYLDVSLPAAGRFQEPLAAGHTAFLYVFEGNAAVAGSESTIASGRLAVLGEGEGVAVTAGAEGARFLLVAARPLGEPIARYGPFVMNTREEIQQAITDFQSGRF